MMGRGVEMGRIRWHRVKRPGCKMCRGLMDGLWTGKVYEVSKCAR